jgi:hypothetical protein
MVKQSKRRVMKKEKLWNFRAQFIKLYDEYESKLEKLCEEHGAEINFWYSPSRIPQPKFFFGNLGISADTLYSEEEFSLLFSPNITLNKKKGKKKTVIKRRRTEKPQIYIKKS